jgi:hypothetical protein
MLRCRVYKMTNSGYQLIDSRVPIVQVKIQFFFLKKISRAAELRAPQLVQPPADVGNQSGGGTSSAAVSPISRRPPPRRLRHPISQLKNGPHLLFTAQVDEFEWNFKN